MKIYWWTNGSQSVSIFATSERIAQNYARIVLGLHRGGGKYMGLDTRTPEQREAAMTVAVTIRPDWTIGIHKHKKETATPMQTTT